MSTQIEFEHFEQVDIRIGTVVAAMPNVKAIKPATVLEIDFGPLGIRTTSAQITQNYTAENLVGRQIVAVVNLPPKRVAGVKSDVLVLGALGGLEGVVLLRPDTAVENGDKVA